MKTENKLIKKRLKHPLKISTVLHASLMPFYDYNYSENVYIWSRHLSPSEGTLWISGKDASGNIFHQPFGFVLPSHLLLWYIISFSLYLPPVCHFLSHLMLKKLPFLRAYIFVSIRNDEAVLHTCTIREAIHAKKVAKLWTFSVRGRATFSTV